MVRWRLGVDLGTNSIGLAALTINEENHVLELTLPPETPPL